MRCGASGRFARGGHGQNRRIGFHDRARQGSRRASGAVPLMVAVEKGTIPGVAADTGSTRLVVVGDSLFLVNANIEFDANRDFASLAVNWLLDQVQLLAIGPRPIHEYRISLTQSQMKGARWILMEPCRAWFSWRVCWCGRGGASDAA